MMIDIGRQLLRCCYQYIYGQLVVESPGPFLLSFSRSNEAVSTSLGFRVALGEVFLNASYWNACLGRHDQRVQKRKATICAYSLSHLINIVHIELIMLPLSKVMSGILSLFLSASRFVSLFFFFFFIIRLYDVERCVCVCVYMRSLAPVCVRTITIKQMKWRANDKQVRFFFSYSLLSHYHYVNRAKLARRMSSHEMTSVFRHKSDKSVFPFIFIVVFDASSFSSPYYQLRVWNPTTSNSNQKETRHFSSSQSRTIRW